MEGVVRDGWLVKSPPEKRILKAKWRQRWFVLRHSGQLPGQFILEYFTDNTCKKLKGKIDLDQCEQVDAGLTFLSKKTSYQYMFDIRTPKRIYYLVADTEAEMNKWVDCICSVCGLKIHVEEGSVTAFDSISLNSLSVLSQGLLSSTTLLSSIGFNNNFLVPPESSTANTATSTTVTGSTTGTNLTHIKSSSNPYIPISECHTGKPVLNGNLQCEDSFGDLPKEPPPPPPPKGDWSSQELVTSGEFYDYPRPLNPQSSIDDFNRVDCEADDNTYKIPIQVKSDLNATVNNDAFNSLPPRVNWKTYPDDPFNISSSTVPRKMSGIRAESVEYDIVPPFHGTIKEGEATRKNVHNLASHFESISLKATDTQFVPPLESNYLNEINIVPPRPPKPSKLRDRHRYENFELPHHASKDEDSSTYDVPPSSKGVFLSKQLPAQTFSSIKNESGDDLSPSTKVPLSSSAGKETLLMDDTYDFPKFRSEDNINAMVPLPQSTGTLQRQRRHAYTNAPPGLFNSKDLIFNYEYRPSLMTADGYLCGDVVKSEHSIHNTTDTMTPPSPSVIGAYANVPTSPTLAASYQNDIPPAVNRELKPKRVSSNEDRGSISFLTLQPPPVCRSRTKGNKRSFRKPRAAPSPTPKSSLNGMPPIPNRFRHHADVSTTSDDDLSNSSGSRRNSSNDDQARHFFAAPNKKDEIQYLDLDLDSEPSPSPKSPERMSASTVYKKVDFVKTKAFNEMRQNVEESYRKSQ